MVRGEIMGNQKTDLVVVQGNMNAQLYVAEVLKAHALPFYCQHGPGVTLMQDNASRHSIPCSKTSMSCHGPQFPRISTPLSTYKMSWVTKHELIIRLTMFMI